MTRSRDPLLGAESGRSERETQPSAALQLPLGRRPRRRVVGGQGGRAVAEGHARRLRARRTSASRSVPAEAIVQGAFLNASAITEAIREAIDNGKIKTKNVAAAVSGHSVIVKKVSLPAMTREELDEQIRWEAEQYIPFDVNEVNLDFQILERRQRRGPDGSPAGRREEGPDRRLRAGDPARRAWSRSRSTSPPSRSRTPSRPTTRSARGETVALVNIGAQVVNINIVSNGVPCFTRDITTAGNQYTEEIQKALSISFDEAERIKLGGRRTRQPGRGAAGSRAGGAERSPRR